MSQKKIKILPLFCVLVTGCPIENLICNLRPDADYVVHSGDWKGIEWLDKSQVKPTQVELDAELVKCQQNLKASRETTVDNRLDSLESKVTQLEDVIK